MAVMTSAPGHFAIPTAPAVGVTVAQSASANTFGSYVQMIASTASALYITGISATVTQGATPSTYIALDIGVGGAGSEVLQDQQVAGTGAAASVPFAIFIPIYPYVPVANAQRIAVKTASDVASALSWKITLMCIAQSNVVDDGVAESCNVKQINSVVQVSPGANGGLLIAGSNTGPVTITGGMVLNGTAASGATPATAGLTLTGGAASTTGGGVAAAGLASTGGAGAASTNGAAAGASMTGGGTNTVASTASGLLLNGASNGSGIDATGGSGASGMKLIAGATGNTNNAGLQLIGPGGTGFALKSTAGPISITGLAAAGATAGSAGIVITGGAASTSAAASPGIQITGGAGAASTNGAASGAIIQGGGTNTVASAAHGLQVLGTSTGSGLSAGSGSGATGDGATFTSNATAGNGITATHSGSGVFDLNATTTPLILAKTTNITGFNDITAAAAATTIWQDLTSSGDFGTAGSIGALLKADINAPIGSIPTNPLTTLGATAPSNWLDTGQFTTAACNMLADFHLRRHQANVETSSFGDSLAVGSLYGMIQMSQAADTTTTASSITIFKTDLATHLGTIAIIASAGANPITQVGA